ncbi:RagB/SusD family nutrient uptake outer membrane protein [Mucilaginibacter sp. UR6-11]|uniref:RagB/SusD family nutrient uptake outer membrane protein n=1 Tax=Mucilaginibacter sp. UR6-11 TaxID=1435644 RepID=UPI001E4F6D07|nr:RagB/SusD family nutrient uptake outer membrane protein [Mucilaginibacter sp. UR6-11]MCC8423707.1 RagB/SusD family nutrient uptake outer membrane protein [Mucilaginibacter sp. UR6-11]
MRKLSTLFNTTGSKGILVAFLILSSTSCKKNFLDTVPLTSISDVVAYDTPERILAQVNGLYASAKTGTFLGGRYILYNETRADEFIQTKSNTVTGLNTWSQSVNSSTDEVVATWSNPYAVINKVNTFIKGLTDNKSKVSATLYTQYIAEAKFLRALCYYDLVKVFARPYATDGGKSPGVPLRLQAESSNSNNDLVRSSVAAVYTQILSDLNDAEAGLPLTYATAVLNATRAHRNTAIALKTRIYLTMGDYGNVITEANKIVSPTAPYQASTGVNNKLETSQVTVFAGSYTGPEAVLFFPFTTADAPGTTSALTYLYTYTPGNGEYYLNPAGTISNPVYSTASTDTRKTLVVTGGTNKWLNKFKSASPYPDYIPVIRYAEVLLNLAEAAAQKDDLATALNMLYAVRHRSDPTFIFAPADIATKGALINTILTERKIEFLGEGFRVPDLQRLLLPLPAKTAPTTSAPAVAVSASNYIWPISVNETSINKLCEPNP